MVKCIGIEYEVKNIILNNLIQKINFLNKKIKNQELINNKAILDTGIIDQVIKYIYFLNKNYFYQENE